MQRKRDSRGPKRRGFDDDFTPHEPASRRTSSFGSPRSDRPQRMAPQPEGPAVDATVKFFSAEKGFGFVELGDGSGDAFLHVSVLQAVGHDAVQQGTKLRVNVGQGQKGRQVTAVLEVDTTSAVATPARGPRGPGGPPRRSSGREEPDASSAVTLRGTVKWFNETKGFGFAAAEDGGKDVFIHISVLTKSGIPNLAEGQGVEMRVVQTPKGREAISISTAD